MLAESTAFYASYGVLWALVLALALLVLVIYRHFGMVALPASMRVGILSFGLLVHPRSCCSPLQNVAVRRRSAVGESFGGCAGGTWP